MQRIHVLWVDQEPTEFAPLAAAITADGGRLGWLDWSPADELDTSRLASDSQLVSAAALPTLRAVAVEPGREVMIKPRRGAPVLRDVVREHFRGCRVVLARGALDPKALDRGARLTASTSGYRVITDGFDRTMTATVLAGRLRRPRPFGDSPPSPAS